MRQPALVLAAHGTRDPRGAVVTRELAASVGARVCYVDVGGPSLADVLSGVDDPVVVVPAFLAAGYHVRVDLPAQLADTGRRDVAVTAPVGAHPGLLDAVVGRLRLAGWRYGDAVVLAAAGSADPRAVADVRRVAAALSRQVARGVRVGFAATGEPRVGEVVRSLRAGGERRVAVASWLLAPGFFQRSLAGCGADVVAGPLGAHPRVADAVLARYRAAAPLLRAA